MNTSRKSPKLKRKREREIREEGGRKEGRNRNV
jgi:hypothetical protein